MADYFDASALVAMVLDEPPRPRVRAHIAQASEPPLISDFGIAEVSSAVSRLVRTKEKTAGQASEAIHLFDSWASELGQPISVDPSDVREANLLVRQFELKLRTPDALHLAICRRLGARMVTLDNNLANAARAVDVAFINPAADGQADPQSDPKRKI